MIITPISLRVKSSNAVARRKLQSRTVGSFTSCACSRNSRSVTRTGHAGGATSACQGAQCVHLGESFPLFSHRHSCRILILANTTSGVQQCCCCEQTEERCMAVLHILRYSVYTYFFLLADKEGKREKSVFFSQKRCTFKFHLFTTCVYAIGNTYPSKRNRARAQDQALI